MAASALVISVTQANNAQADGLLGDGLLGGGILTQQLCTPVQSGVGNQFTAPQTTQCNQGASSSTTSTTPNAGGPVTGYEVLNGSDQCERFQFCFVELTCPTGKRAVGGGFAVASTATYKLVRNLATEDGQGWIVEVINEAEPTAPTLTLFARTSCVNVTP